MREEILEGTRATKQREKRVWRRYEVGESLGYK